MIKIAGGYKQPIAKLPENESRIGHPCPSSALNKNLKREMNEIVTKAKKKK